MKAIQYTEKGKTEIVDIEKPACGPDNILLRTMYSGLSNGTERNQLLGGNYGGTYPRFPGYQIVGKIVETGEDITKFAEDEIVFYGNCGQGHKEFIIAKETDLILKLSDDFDMQAASLLAVSAVAYRNTMRLKITEEDKAIVFGGGIIGMVSAQLAKHLGADVWFVTGNQEKLDMAQEMGINTISRHSSDWVEQLESEKPFSAVIETSGAELLDMIIGIGWNSGLLSYEGRLALVAGRDQISYNSNAAQGRAISIYQSTHFRLHELEAIAELIRIGSIKIKPFIKDIIDIDNAVSIYNRLRDKPSTLFGTVFRW